ncbi:MAG: hypothetical protein ABI625_05515, partial [bacterium]
MNSRSRGTLLMALGVAGFSVAFISPLFRFVAIIVGLVFLLIGATTFGSSGQIADAMQSHVKRPARVTAWGLPLPVVGEAVFEIDSVSALGAGLHIHLRGISGAPPRTDLKIAQPATWVVGADRLEIGSA